MRSRKAPPPWAGAAPPPAPTSACLGFWWPTATGELMWGTRVPGLSSVGVPVLVARGACRVCCDSPTASFTGKTALGVLSRAVWGPGSDRPIFVDVACWSRDRRSWNYRHRHETEFLVIICAGCGWGQFETRVGLVPLRGVVTGGVGATALSPALAPLAPHAPCPHSLP